MSWFKRAPRPKNPPSAPAPKHFSHLAETIMEERKQQVRSKSPDKPKKK